MFYSHNTEYNIAVKNARYKDTNASHIHNTKHKEPDTKGYILYHFIYEKFKNRQNRRVVTEVRTGVP